MATLRDLVAQVATAYFSNTNVSVGDIPVVMGSIATSLRCSVDEPALRPAEDVARDTPKSLDRAEVQRSITSEALISFEDGRPYKTLRRHLAARGLTPAQYRAKYNLPDDYPMVAPKTSATRSQLARRIGLGGPRRKAVPPKEGVVNGPPSRRPTRGALEPI